MKVVHCEQVTSTPVEAEGSVGCNIRVLIGPDDAAPHFTMRQIEIAVGGHTSHHAHPHEHEIFILEGSGIVMEGAQEHAIRPGTVVYVPPKQVHQFRNTGATPLRMLCLIPHTQPGLLDSCLLTCGGE